LIAEGKHPDVQTIMPTKRSSTITVEQVENLLPFAYMKPLKGKCKVFVISEADRLGSSSANKLLKTLEEPPPSTVFVLVTERPESVLPTVASRCQPVKFGRLRTDTVADILASEFGVDRERAAVAAELADGQITRGLLFADTKRFEAVTCILESLGSVSARIQAYERLQELLAEERARLEDEAEHKIVVPGEVLTSGMKTALEDLRKSFIDRNYREFLNDCLGLLLTLYRDILVLKETNAEELILNRDKVGSLRTYARALSLPAVRENMKVIEEITVYCSHYVGEDRAFLDLLLRLREPVEG